MEKVFYVDSAIWRDYFEDRKDGIKPIGLFAFNFLNECKRRKIKLLFSEAIVFELESYLIDVQNVFSSFGELLTEVNASEEQFNEAQNLSSRRDVPFNDALHAILARDNEATLVSRDWHFEKLKDIAEYKRPEEVTFD